MSRYRKVSLNILTSFLFTACISFSNHVFAQDGASLFKANCASCHKPDKDFAGPALQGWKDRVPGGTWIYDWVKNPSAMIAKDAYAKSVFDKWKPTMMTAFGTLKNEEIDAIMKYVDDFKPDIPVGPGGTVTATAPSDGNSLLYGILTLILAVVAFILLQVNQNLKKLTDEKDGIYRGEPVPFYRNKVYIMTAILALFALGGYWVTDGLIGLGRQQNYMPKQPIFYSHQVHAGVNQISCLYCHGGAQDSKQAAIPSVNTCMNCHKAISEYKGELVLQREDGTAVNGTEEIRKLYAYAGWNPDTKSYNPDTNADGIPDGAKPIEWVKIHNLPDHVYFNHSQHVSVGKQQCQTCHGNIQDMPEVKQFSDLSMGWCVNCHRQTKVNFEGNKFYSIYESFHKQMADSVKDSHGHMVANPHKLDSVTVDKIGGTECQKCHY